MSALATLLSLCLYAVAEPTVVTDDFESAVGGPVVLVGQVFAVTRRGTGTTTLTAGARVDELQLGADQQASLQPGSSASRITLIQRAQLQAIGSEIGALSLEDRSEATGQRAVRGRGHPGAG
jgi:hypothetical protein